MTQHSDETSEVSLLLFGGREREILFVCFKVCHWTIYIKYKHLLILLCIDSSYHSNNKIQFSIRFHI